MKKLLIISILLANVCYGQITRMLINGHKHNVNEKVVAQFNFALSSTAGNVPDWVDALGFPLTAVRTAIDSRSGIGLTISSVNTAYWANIPSTSTANNSGGATVANPTFVFPAGVALGWWGNGLTTYTAGQECLQLNGLDATKSYKIEFFGSRTTTNPSRRCVYYVVDANGTMTDTLDVKNNTANLAVISGRVPISGGTLKLHMKLDGSDANNIWGAYLNGLRITQEAKLP